MHAVVFGRVEEGMPVVRKIEACGSSSGRTRQPVVVADCGELPSRRQILAKIAAEKEALANMKKDPNLVGACPPPTPASAGMCPHANLHVPLLAGMPP